MAPFSNDRSMMEELRARASEREISVIRKRTTGPIIIMQSRTGKTLGTFTNETDALALVLTYDVVPVVVPEFVNWNWDVIVPVFDRVCSNNHGPTCLCLDTTGKYLCAVPQCMFQAGCFGCCPNHYSQLKVFGDLTKHAMAKTAILAENGQFDLENLPEYKKMISLKRVVPTERNKKNLTPSELQKATMGIIGMSVVWTGSEYLLVDKDGNILDRVEDKKDLLED